MRIQKVAKAGSLESSDILIMIMPKDELGIDIELESVVEKQFGQEIRDTILTTAMSLGVVSAVIKAQDKGALDYTIKARVETAIKRAV